MIFAPEYSGVCSWRIDLAPAEYARCAPSGDQLIAPMLMSSGASRCSVASASDRVHRSTPVAVRPVPLGRTNATRVASGEPVTLLSAAEVVHTAAGVPPFTATCQRSPA